MMAVIINHQDSTSFTLNLKPAFGPSKFSKRTGNVFELDAKVESNRHSCKRVVHVVEAGYGKLHHSGFMTKRANNKLRAELSIQSDCSRRYISLNGGSIADSSPCQFRDDRLNVLVVEANNDSSVKWNTIGKNSETFLDLFDATSEMVEMIGIDVSQHGYCRSQKK